MGRIIGILILFLIVYPTGFIAVAGPTFLAMVSNDWATLSQEITKSFQQAEFIALGITMAFFPGLLTFLYYIYRTLTKGALSSFGAIFAGLIIGLICAGVFAYMGLQEINTPEGGPSKLPHIAGAFIIAGLAGAFATLLTNIFIRMFGLMRRE